MENKEQVSVCHCNKCGYDWIPRSLNRPKKCPRCYDYYWDGPVVPPKVVQLDENNKPIERGPTRTTNEIKKPIFDRGRRIVHIDPSVKVDPARVYHCDEGQLLDYADVNLKGHYEKYRL